jgi:hypothetical protein
MDDSHYLLHRFLHVLHDPELRQIDAWQGDGPDARSREDLMTSISGMTPDALKQTVPNLQYEPNLGRTWQSVVTWHEREVKVAMDAGAAAMDSEEGLEDLGPGRVLPYLGDQPVHDAPNTHGAISLKKLSQTDLFASPNAAAGSREDNWLMLRSSASEPSSVIVYNGNDTVMYASGDLRGVFLNYAGPFTHWEVLGDAQDRYQVKGKMRGKWLPSG